MREIAEQLWNDLLIRKQENAAASIDGMTILVEPAQYAHKGHPKRAVPAKLRITLFVEKDPPFTTERIVDTHWPVAGSLPSLVIVLEEAHKRLTQVRGEAMMKGLAQ